MSAIPNPTILILHRPYLKASTILGSRGVASLSSSFHSSQCVHAFWYSSSRRAGSYCSALFVSAASWQSQAAQLVVWFQGFSGSRRLIFQCLSLRHCLLGKPVKRSGNRSRKSPRCIALRPELTPSLARLVIQQGKSASLPLKWFAVGQCWRYERMTRGRRREHYQWNMDIIGVPEVTVSEILKAMSSYMAVVEYPMTTIDRNAFKVQYYLAWSNRPNIDVVILYKYGFGWEHNPAYICLNG